MEKSYPLTHVKKLFLKDIRIPIDSAILAAVGHCFIANKQKTKNSNVQV